MKDSAKCSGTRGLVKIRGIMDGVEFQSSFMALGNGKHKLPVSAKIRKAIGKRLAGALRSSCTSDFRKDATIRYMYERARSFQ
jgi:hypothetical protein